MSFAANIFAIVVGLGQAWLGGEIARFDAQDRLLSELEGSFFGWEGPFVRQEKVKCPFLKWAVPEEQCFRARQVQLCARTITFDQMQKVAQLPWLEGLVLFLSGVDDDGLRGLTGARLRTLRLDCCLNITDTGMPHVNSLTRLECLSIAGTRVTDAGLRSLDRLTDLKMLMVRYTAVSDAGIPHVVAHMNLRHLDLAGTSVGDQACKLLASMESLECLDLGQTRVTDTGLAALSEGKGLVRLNILDTQVTDRGLAQLTKLNTLRMLFVKPKGRDAITLDGLARLHDATPECRIFWAIPGRNIGLNEFPPKGMVEHP